MWKLMIELLAAGLGTAAFALLFSVPPAYYLRCGVIGGAGWLCYRLLLGLGTAPSIFFATVLVVFFSRYSAVKRRCPVTLFLIPGIFPLVPGAGIYWTAYSIVVSRLDQAAGRGFATIKSAVAIVLGILLVFELPQGLFRALVARLSRFSARGRAAGG